MCNFIGIFEDDSGEHFTVNRNIFSGLYYIAPHDGGANLVFDKLPKSFSDVTAKFK